jgi:hypothetical protein
MGPRAKYPIAVLSLPLVNLSVRAPTAVLALPLLPARAALPTAVFWWPVVVASALVPNAVLPSVALVDSSAREPPAVLILSSLTVGLQPGSDTDRLGPAWRDAQRKDESSDHHDETND